MRASARTGNAACTPDRTLGLVPRGVERCGSQCGSQCGATQASRPRQISGSLKVTENRVQRARPCLGWGDAGEANNTAVAAAKSSHCVAEHGDQAAARLSMAAKVHVQATCKNMWNECKLSDDSWADMEARVQRAAPGPSAVDGPHPLRIGVWFGKQVAWIASPSSCKKCSAVTNRTNQQPRKKKGISFQSHRYEVIVPLNAA